VNFTIEMSKIYIENNPEASGLANELVLDTIFLSKNHSNRHFGNYFNSKCI